MIRSNPKVNVFKFCCTKQDSEMFFLASKATQTNVYFKPSIKSDICAVIAAALPQKIQCLAVYELVKFILAKNNYPVHTQWAKFQLCDRFINSNRMVECSLHTLRCDMFNVILTVTCREQNTDQYTLSLLYYTSSENNTDMKLRKVSYITTCFVCLP